MNNQQTTGNTQNQQEFGRRGRGCGPFGKMFTGQFGGKGNWGKFPGSFGNRKAANIEENDSAFIISLFAAGLVKSNFKISVSEDVLSISYHTDENANADSARYTHREYEPGSFERSFQLNGKVLTDSISASYTDGVLSVTLPKNPETNKPAQEIGVN